MDLRGEAPLCLLTPYCSLPKKPESARTPSRTHARNSAARNAVIREGWQDTARSFLAVVPSGARQVVCVLIAGTTQLYGVGGGSEARNADSRAVAVGRSKGTTRWWPANHVWSRTVRLAGLLTGKEKVVRSPKLDLG